MDSQKRDEPQTMEELLSQYGNKAHGYRVGEKIRGRVIGRDSKKLILDIGGKSEGVVAEKAYNEALGYIKTLEMGDEVEATVIVPETFDGFTILSLRSTAEGAAWEKLMQAEKSGEPVMVVGRGVTHSGIMVDIGGMSGFIPNSQLGKEVSKNTQNLIGKHFKVAVIDIDRNTNKIVLSEKAVTEAGDILIAEKAFENVEEGKTYEGEVTTIYDFGAFVRIDVESDGETVSLEGLVHISELSWDKVGETKDVVRVGDKIEVVVIGKKDNKLAFSLKQTEKDPWQKAAEKYEKDTRVKGKVLRISDYGVFVQLESGIEGLIHMTKIPPGKKIKEGEDVNVYVEEIDSESRKISLGLVLTEKPVGYK